MAEGIEIIERLRDIQQDVLNVESKDAMRKIDYLIHKFALCIQQAS
tara:strand:- start:50 stop:187 length:138 start_codon:yes stop_codon:yes gene_type:complete